jgi:folate-binding protein YgfZ
MAERGGAASFGDVTGEYLAMRDRAAWVAPWHEVVWVRGPDTVTFLDGLVSQAVEPLATGQTARSLLLAPQGKLRAPHLLLRGEAEVGLLTDPGCGETIAEDLGRFKIRVDATIELDPSAVTTIVGPDAAAVVATMTGAEPPASGWHRTGDVTTVVVPFARTRRPRIVVIGGDQRALGDIKRAGRLAMDAVRIEAGEALMGVDVDERTIPQEAGLVDDAVDFTKGCYLGQELVARIDSRGRVNRHLRGIRVETTVLPPVGSEVVAGDAIVGSITSVAESLDLRAPVGLALVRREVEPGTAVELRWDGGAAAAIMAELPMMRAPGS